MQNCSVQPGLSQPPLAAQQLHFVCCTSTFTPLVKRLHFNCTSQLIAGPYQIQLRRPKPILPGINRPICTKSSMFMSRASYCGIHPSSSGFTLQGYAFNDINENYTAKRNNNISVVVRSKTFPPPLVDPPPLDLLAHQRIGSPARSSRGRSWVYCPTEAWN